MNKSNKKYIYSCYKSILTAVYILCLVLLPFDHLTFITGIVYANSDNIVEYNLLNDKEDVSVDTSDIIKNTLWRTNITPIEEQQDQAEKDELQLLIEQLNAIDISLSQFSSEIIDEEPMQAIEPEENISEDNNSLQTQKNINDGNMLYEPVTEETILILRKMAEKPEEIDNPFEIGNTLYLSNCVGEAATFYQETLRRKKPDDMTVSGDRAWLLFQIGNCLRSIDMLVAADFYSQLITEYPDSPWADIARVQSNLISWYENDKPQELIIEYQK